MRVVFDMTNNNLSPLGPRSPKKKKIKFMFITKRKKKCKHTLNKLFFNCSKIKC